MVSLSIYLNPRISGDRRKAIPRILDILKITKKGDIGQHRRVPRLEKKSVEQPVFRTQFEMFLKNV